MKAGKVHHFRKRPDEYYSVSQILAWVRDHPLPRDGRRIPVCFWGPRGIGKTAQVQSFCRQADLDLITYHPAHDVSGQDILGQQTIGEGGKLRYAIPEFLPHGEDAGKGVWFIDEINRGNEEVLAGLMEPLGEGTISQSGWRIPDDWQIAVAANPYEKGYGVKELDVAMVSRMLHYNPGWESSLWANWAKQNGVHDDIINFTLKRTELLEIGSSKTAYQIPAEIAPKIVANPRSIEYFDALYEKGMPVELLRLIGYGLVGRDYTEAFILEAQHETEVVLPHEILTSPPDDIYKYDQRLIHWRNDPEEYVRLVHGSMNLLAAELASRPAPVSDNPAESVDVQQIGRFVASLMPLQQEEALQVIMRACHGWHPAVKESTRIWKDALAGLR